jgi:hypothetical protein
MLHPCDNYTSGTSLERDIMVVQYHYKIFPVRDE